MPYWAQDNREISSLYDIWFLVKDGEVLPTYPDPRVMDGEKNIEDITYGWVHLNYFDKSRYWYNAWHPELSCDRQATPPPTTRAEAMALLEKIGGYKNVRPPGSTQPDPLLEAFMLL